MILHALLSTVCRPKRVLHIKGALSINRWCPKILKWSTTQYAIRGWVGIASFIGFFRNKRTKQGFFGRGSGRAWFFQKLTKSSLYYICRHRLSPNHRSTGSPTLATHRSVLPSSVGRSCHRSSAQNTTSARSHLSVLAAKYYRSVPPSVLRQISCGKLPSVRRSLQNIGRTPFLLK